MKVVSQSVSSSIPAWQFAVALLAGVLVVLPAGSVDVTWHDMSNQEQQEWVLRYDIPGSVRHSMTRRSAPAQQRRETQGAQQRHGVLEAQQRYALQAAQERRASQGAEERRAGGASGRTHGHEEDRGYRPLGYYGSVRHDSR